jgi:hypothetical protein
MKLIAAGTLALALAANTAQPRQAFAWGDDGHKVIALIAQSFLQADVSKRVNALLAADTDSLTAHDIASAATWADKFRDSNIGGARLKTRQWHFVDIEISAPDLDKACFNHPVTKPSHAPTNASRAWAPHIRCDNLDGLLATLSK